jgi:hypothetical protein
VDVVHVGEGDMLNEDDLSATSILSFCGPTHVVVAERDTVELKKYVADREARLARTWRQIASPSCAPAAVKKS